MYRGRGDASVDLVVQPVLDLVSRNVSESVHPEPGQHEACEIASIRLLRSLGEAAAQRQELIGSVGNRHIGVTRIDPRAPQHLGIELPQKSLSVGLSAERAAVFGACRITESGAIARSPLLYMAHSDLRAPRKWGRGGGGRPRIGGGSPVSAGNSGDPRLTRKEPLSRNNTCSGVGGCFGDKTVGRRSALVCLPCSGAPCIGSA